MTEEITQKQIDRTYAYFDKQTDVEKKKILDKFSEQRTRTGKAAVEFKNVTTLKELCKQYSSDLYNGTDEDNQAEMVKDIYKALREIWEKEQGGNTRSYANLAGADKSCEKGKSCVIQGGKRCNRKRTQRKNKRKNKKSRRN